MKLNKIFGMGAALAITLASVGASAAAMTHEITGGVNGAGTYTSFKTAGVSDHTISLGLSGGYDYAMTDMLQVGVATALDWVKPKSTPAGYGTLLLVGPTLNFGDEMESAFFVTAKAGLDYVKNASKTSVAKTAFEGLAGFGKRIPIFANVTYKPTFNFVVSRLDAKNTYSYTVKFLNLSVIF